MFYNIQNLKEKMDIQNFTLCPEERQRLFLSRTGIDDSVLSSVCGISTVEDSLKKLEQLKQLNQQTQNQEATLIQKHDQLQQELTQLQIQLDGLIQKHVNPPKQIKKSSQICSSKYKIMKPGSILSKLTNDYSCINFASNHSSKTTIQLQDLPETSRRYHQKQAIVNKSIQNFKEDLKDERFSKTTENSPYVSPSATPTHSYRKSLGNNQNLINKLWEKQNKGKRISQVDSNKNMKSYLSPRHNRSYLPISGNLTHYRK